MSEGFLSKQQEEQLRNELVAALAGAAAARHWAGIGETSRALYYLWQIAGGRSLE